MVHTQSSSFPTVEAPVCIIICGALSGRMHTENYSPEPDRSRLSVTEGCWDLDCGKGEAFFILGNSALAANAGKMSHTCITTHIHSPIATFIYPHMHV